MVQINPPEDWIAPVSSASGKSGSEQAIAEDKGPEDGPSLANAVSPTEVRFKRWLLYVAASAALIVVSLGGWAMFFPGEPAGKKPGDKPIAPLPQDVKPDETSPDSVHSEQREPRSEATSTDSTNEQPPPATETAPSTTEHTLAPPDLGKPDTPEPGEPSDPQESPPEKPSEAEKEPRAEEPDRAEPGDADPGDAVEVEPTETPELPGHVPEMAIRLPEPAPVDIAARMADVIPEIRMADMSLCEAIEMVASLSTLPITVDPDSLVQRQVTMEDAIRIEMENATVGTILEAIVGQRGLGVVSGGVEGGGVEGGSGGGHVIITLPASLREGMRTRPYTLSDLVGEDPDATTELAELALRLVAPLTWEKHGGKGKIEPGNGRIVVTHDESVHDQLIVFFEKLRVARGLLPRSRLAPRRLELTTARGRAAETLARPVTANFHQPTPLTDILDYLGELCDADLLIDHHALAEDRMSAKGRVSLSVEQRPLGKVLEQLLHPLGLDYRAVDTSLLQVTTRRKTTTRMELEFYSVLEHLARGETAESLTDRLRSQIAESTWTDIGGPGTIYFDEPSKCLIIRQSQPVQAQIRGFLEGQPGLE